MPRKYGLEKFPCQKVFNLICRDRSRPVLMHQSENCESLNINMNRPIAKYTGCIKKTEQTLNHSQRREAAQSMKFFINIDCLGTYDVE